MDFDKFLTDKARKALEEPETPFSQLSPEEQKQRWLEANRCAASGCMSLGVMSHGTRGNMPFYCRDHFWGQS